MNIYLEIFGYIGTAFVITSMMMSSVLKLRCLNTVGSVISMTYAILCNTWPVVILNFSLATINIYKLIASSRVKVAFRHITARPDDETVAYFLLNHRADIEKAFPEYTFGMEDETVAHLVYAGDEMASLLLGYMDGDVLRVTLDYASPKYRDRSIADYLHGQLQLTGVRKICQTVSNTKHKKYLDKIGFSVIDGGMVKELTAPVLK